MRHQALLPALLLAGFLIADSTLHGAPAKTTKIQIQTGRQTKDGTITLAGRDAAQQLLVTAELEGGGFRDRSHDVTYTVTPAGIVSVDGTGYVMARREGKATITAKSSDGHKDQVTVLVTNVVKDLPVNFANQITPIFTKYGCNAGGCHGKADGQNGFKLSLLGFEPTEDYEFVVKEARGRRIFPSSPKHSLLLQKATGQMPHGGGKRLDAESPYYRLLIRWIEQGAPYGREDDPKVTHIQVLPKDRILERESSQQLTVIAHFEDGSTRDVTRMTQFEPNAPDFAEVSMTGLIHAKKLPGVVAIMARFQSHVDVFQATIPLGVKVTKLPPEKTFVDPHVFAQWKKLGLPPSEECDDSTFIRRVTVDLCGRLPTLEETTQFIQDGDKNKHEKLIDRLLASKDYAFYFANKWSSILRNRRKDEKADPEPNAAFHAWLVKTLHENKPYSEMVRGVLTASGEEIKNPPVVWYREVNEPATQIEDVAQLFLGQRIQCAKCHHHPFEQWSQQDYWALTAFFTRLEIKDPPPPRKKRKKGEPAPKKPPLTVTHKPGKAQSRNPKTNQNVLPTVLQGEPLTIDEKQDPRKFLVDWMVKKENPFFAKALVNRYWKHFFGRGLVEPEDDVRVTNPPTNPELLDALAKNFAQSNYDLKKLVKSICLSSVYRRSAVPNDHNANDRQCFSRFQPRRLNAEVLLDSIDDLTQAKTTFKGVPKETRAVQLPDNQFQSYFLSISGRPQSASACECERSSDITLAFTLHLMNSPEMLKKIAGPRASTMSRDKRPHEERVRDLYLLAYAREPSEKELKAIVAYVEKKGKDVSGAYADVLWVLMNSKEFLFNH